MHKGDILGGGIYRLRALANWPHKKYYKEIFSMVDNSKSNWTEWKIIAVRLASDWAKFPYYKANLFSALSG